MGVTRRGLVRSGVVATGGIVTGVAASGVGNPFAPDRLPLDGGYAPAGNSTTPNGSGCVRTVWHVPISRPWVALTFDDGPQPDWTPRVLDTLYRLDATATFFVVGERLRRYANLVRGRYDRHEVGNHTWAHQDLGQRDEQAVREQLRSCHEAIMDELGRTPRLLRPPWGHLGGTTLTVAEEFGYDIAMWSYVMPERHYRNEPTALVAEVLAAVRPGTILLAHDTGAARRLITIDQLAELITGIRARGLHLVTVSQLLAAGAG